jgi:hypothetical protein
LLLGLSWLVGWSSAGKSNPVQVKSQHLAITRQDQDGWIDFFIGDLRSSFGHYRSLLDGQAKVGLHYQDTDLMLISKMACPSPEIPIYLWQALQDQQPPISKL